MKEKPLYFILSRDRGHEVYGIAGGKGWRCPVYDREVPDLIGFEEPDAYNRWFERVYGIPVYRRYLFESEFTESTVFVLEPHYEGENRSVPGSWIRHDTAAAGAPAGSLLSRMLADLSCYYSAPCSMPWISSGGYGIYLDWLNETFRMQGIEPAGAPRQIKSAYVSSVFRCPTAQGDLYLKIPSAVFIRELAITRQLKEWGVLPLPEWIAADERLGCVLMKDMGGKDLPPDAGPDVLLRVMQEWAALQIRAVQWIRNRQSAYPFHDLRPEALSAFAGSLPEESGKWLEGSPYRLTAGETRRLAAGIVRWQESCRLLQAGAVPLSLDHGDLRPDNIRLVPEGIVFYDWAWSAVAHPFISAAAFLHHLSGSQPKDVIMHLKEGYLEAWTSFAARNELEELYEAAVRLQPLQAAALESRWMAELAAGGTGGGSVSPASPDAWTLERRQFYYAQALRRLQE